MKRSWRKYSYEEWHGLEEWFSNCSTDPSGPAEELQEFHNHLIWIFFWKVFLKNILKCHKKIHRFKWVLYQILINWSYHNRLTNFHTNLRIVSPANNSVYKFGLLTNVLLIRKVHDATLVFCSPSLPTNPIQACTHLFTQSCISKCTTAHVCDKPVSGKWREGIYCLCARTKHNNNQ